MYDFCCPRMVSIRRKSRVLDNHKLKIFSLYSKIFCFYWWQMYRIKLWDKFNSWCKKSRGLSLVCFISLNWKVGRWFSLLVLKFQHDKVEVYSFLNPSLRYGFLTLDPQSSRMEREVWHKGVLVIKLVPQYQSLDGTMTCLCLEVCDLPFTVNCIFFRIWLFLAKLPSLRI